MKIMLDYFFTLFHGSLVLFNVTGWIWQKTRQIHLACISLTLLSWFGLGFFYGWGYCPFTDWHWQVKRSLGETDLPASYITYFADRLTGRSWDPAMVDTAVVLTGITAFFFALYLNWRDRENP